MVECLVECNELREILHGDLLRRFPDLSFMAKKLHLKKIRLADLYKLYTIGEDKCHLFVCVHVFIYLSIYLSMAFVTNEELISPSSSFCSACPRAVG